MRNIHKKAACTPQPKSIWPCRHTNFRKLNRKLGQIDRRRFNRQVRKELG